MMDTGDAFANTLACLPGVARMAKSMSRCDEYAGLLGPYRRKANIDDSFSIKYSLPSARSPGN